MGLRCRALKDSAFPEPLLEGPVVKALQGSRERRYKAAGLVEQSVQVAEERGVGIRLEIGAASVLAAQQQADGDQRLKFSLKTGGRRFQMPGQFGHEPPMLRLEQCGRQHTSPNRREGRIENAAGTHNE